MLEIIDLTIKYGNELILDGINLKFEKGNLYGLIGINGSGKTSILNAVVKFVNYKGDIKVNGQDVKSLDRMELSRKVSYMRQHFSVNFSYTVEEIVNMSGYSSLGNKADNSFINEIIEVAELKDILHKNILEISGGQRQRAFFAKTLAQDSDVILIDEGFSNIDIYYQLRFLNYLHELAIKRDKTVILVIHDINFTFKQIDKVVVFDGAKVYGNGKTQDIISSRMLKDVFRVNAQVTKDGINYNI